MAYIPLTYSELDDSGVKFSECPLPLLGIYLSDNDGIPDGKAWELSDFDITAKGLCARKPLTKLLELPDFTGTVNGRAAETFEKKMIFHKGTRLYGVSEKGELSVFADNLPDKNSIIVEFMSKLLVYCDSHVYSLDKDFVFEELEPEAPVAYENVDIASYAVIKEDFVPNLVSPRITVKYNRKNETVFGFPVRCDLTRPIKLYYGDETVDLSDAVISELAIRQAPDCMENEVRVEYYVKDGADIGWDDRLYKCKCAVSYGGNNAEGTRLIFTGNADRRGEYCVSGLKKPLYFGKDETEIVGDGCENVTGCVKMYGNLILFTEKSVYKMSYSYSEETGVVFPIKELNSGIGCDIPKSIAIVDNRAVFANSEKGIFIVDSDNYLGEHVVKPISACILKGRNRGFLDMPQEKMKTAFAVDFDRKYMFFCSPYVFVWDYDKAGFSASSSHEKSQNRLVWYTYDGIEAQAAFEISGKLYTVFGDGVYSLDETAVGGIKVNPVFVSDRIDFSYPVNEKTVSEAIISLSAKENAVVTFTFCDGKTPYFKKTLNLEKGFEKPVRVKIPGRRLYGFSFAVESEGRIDIRGIGLRYKVKK